MRHLHVLAICGLFFTGCSSSDPQSPTAGKANASVSGAVAELNRQIEKFNAERPGDRGITPIAQRVSRIELAVDGATATCFDGKGAWFLVLTRQSDGNFKGSVKTKYHELAKPEGHSWGEVVAEFTLPKEMFQQNGAANAAPPHR